MTTSGEGQTTASQSATAPVSAKSYGGLQKIPEDVLFARYGLLRDELDALKQTLAPGASDYDLMIFLATARRLGLDVLVPGMLQLMRFEGKSGVRWVTNIGYRGELALAEATGELLGHEERIDFDDHRNPVRATCRVWRKGWSKAFEDSVSMEEAKNDRNPVWDDRPEVMLKNAAIKRAVSLAFPKRFTQFKANVLQESGVALLAPGEKGTGLSIPGEHHDTPPPVEAEAKVLPASVEETKREIRELLDASTGSKEGAKAYGLLCEALDRVPLQSLVQAGPEHLSLLEATLVDIRQVLGK
jgi:hypothetical protein